MRKRIVAYLPVLVLLSCTLPDSIGVEFPDDFTVQVEGDSQATIDRSDGAYTWVVTGVVVVDGERLENPSSMDFQFEVQSDDLVASEKIERRALRILPAQGIRTGTFGATVTVEFQGKSSTKTLSGELDINSRPVVGGLTVVPTEGTINEEFSAEATASDGDDDPLTYSWLVDGELRTDYTGPAIELGTFSEKGMHTVSVTARDDSESSEAVEATFEVINIPPVIEEVLLDGGPLPQGEPQYQATQTLTFSANVKDEDNEDDDVVRRWRLKRGDAVEDEQLGKEYTIQAGDIGLGIFTVLLTVDDQDPGGTVEADPFTFTITDEAEELAITTEALPSGSWNQKGGYEAVLNAEGGDEPYVWSVSGDLPVGLELNAATGVISGTPTPSNPNALPGLFPRDTFPITASATDAGDPSQTDTKSFTLVIEKQLLIALKQPIPDGNQCVAYMSGPVFGASGGSDLTAREFAITGLPGGLEVLETNGEAGISGTPTEKGVFELLVEVRIGEREWDEFATSLTIGDGNESCVTARPASRE